jgi:Zn-dependent protease
MQISILIILPVIIFSVMIHENAHGLVALFLGDKTAKNSGRLSLNPLKHADPFGSVLLPIMSWFVFGWPVGYAKPVPINPYYFKNQRTGMMLTAIAGPVSNLSLAFIAASFFKIGIFPLFFQVAILINVVLAAFNLLPIPPLDGSKVLAGLIPSKWLASYYRLERYGIVIIFLLVFIFPGVIHSLLGLIINPLFRLLGV